MILELPAPGMQDTSKPGELSAEEAGIAGEAFEGFRRRLDQGLVGQPGMGAAEGAQGFRDSKGEEEVRAWELFVELFMEPLLRLLGLTLWTMAIAAGMRETVLLATALAGIEAVAVGTGAAGADGLQSCEVCRRQVGVACTLLCAIGGEDGGDRGHDGNPRMTAWMRWTASSWPLWVRWRYSLVVSSRACPIYL